MTKTIIFKTTEISSLVDLAQDFSKHLNSLILIYNNSQIHLTTKILYGPKIYPIGYNPQHTENLQEALAITFGKTPFTIELPLSSYPNLSPDRLSLFLSKKLTQTTITLDSLNTQKITFTQLYEDFLKENKDSIFAHARANTIYNTQGHATISTDNDPWENEAEDESSDLYERTKPKPSTKEVTES